MSRALTPHQLAEVARVAKAEGVTITVEAGGRVYRIAPGEHKLPITANEKDVVECDQAFGLSG